jgi:hypothetical protein
MSEQEDRFQALKKRAIAGYLNIADTLSNLADEIRSDVQAEPDDLHLESGGTSRGADLIAAERLRQIERQPPFLDERHSHGELAVRAAELAVHATDETVSTHLHERDAWGLVAKHGRDRVRQLVIAGALIAAEIDRKLAQAGS